MKRGDGLSASWGELGSPTVPGEFRSPYLQGDRVRVTEQDIDSARAAGTNPYVALINVADAAEPENVWVIDYIGVPDIPANRCSYVWVFKGGSEGIVSGVFSTHRKGHEWIKKHRLSGLLVHYPLDMGVYDWAEENGGLTSVQVHLARETFTTASQHYYVYEDGVCLNWPEYDTLETEDEDIYYTPYKKPA